MEIRYDGFDIEPTHGSGPVVVAHLHVLPGPVRRATAVLAGYTAKFSQSDHELGRLTVKVEAIPFGLGTRPEVAVLAEFGLRDWSGEWDDSYSGHVQYTLLAELEPPPRSVLETMG